MVALGYQSPATRLSTVCLFPVQIQPHPTPACFTQTVTGQRYALVAPLISIYFPRVLNITKRAPPHLFMHHARGS